MYRQLDGRGCYKSKGSIGWLTEPPNVSIASRGQSSFLRRGGGEGMTDTHPGGRGSGVGGMGVPGGLENEG